MTIEELKKENEALKKENIRLQYLILDIRKDTDFYQNALRTFYAEESKDIVMDDAHELACVLMKPLRDMHLSGRAYNILRALGCKTLGDMVKNPKEVFVGLPQVGPKTYNEIFTLAEYYQLDFGMDVDSIIDEDMKKFLEKKTAAKK